MTKSFGNVILQIYATASPSLATPAVKWVYRAGWEAGGPQSPSTLLTLKNTNTDYPSKIAWSVPGK